MATYLRLLSRRGLRRLPASPTAGSSCRSDPCPPFTSPSTLFLASGSIARRQPFRPTSRCPEARRKAHWGYETAPIGRGYNRIAFVGSAVFTLCRSRESRTYPERHDEPSPSSVGPRAASHTRQDDDDSDGVNIPIDFGPAHRTPIVRDHNSSHPRHGSSDTWWDRAKTPPSFGPGFTTGDGGVFGKTSMAGVLSFIGNVSPNGFGNLFLTCCGSVFGLWFMSDRMRNPWLSHFMQRHFVASRDSLRLGRWHTLLTCAISHSSLMHLLFNCMMFHQLIGTFARQMAPPGASQYSASSIDRLFRAVSSGIENLLWKEKKPTPRRNNVQTSDIINVLLLSALGSSLGHVFLYSTPVLGASGAISGLVYLLASTFPNSYFRTVFPIPGLQLSILQVGQLFVLTNLYFLYYRSGLRNIAWAAHLFGMGAGAAYCYFQQHVFKRTGFHNPVLLSIQTAKRQWLRTFRVRHWEGLLIAASAPVLRYTSLSGRHTGPGSRPPPLPAPLSTLNYHIYLNSTMTLLAARLRCAFAWFLVSVSAVHCIEESSVVEWDTGFRQHSPRGSNEHLSSTHAPSDHVRDASSGLEASAVCAPPSTSSVDQSISSAAIYPQHCDYRPIIARSSTSLIHTSSRPAFLESTHHHGLIRSHRSNRSDSDVSGNGGSDVSNYGFFGGPGNSGESLRELIDENRTSGGVLLVDFYATWCVIDLLLCCKSCRCQPCTRMSANLRVVESRYKPGKLVVFKIDVDENQQLAAAHNITALPTILLFTRGAEFKRLTGVVEVGDLIDMIDDALDHAS
ncbi:rhomboid protease ROM6, putative [Babesia caballi]|uniref:Rhomboid protease ROM6, putative n=1 Tax=Babesia caballi TaxID=5871 RepID=A0AAV4LUN0_BABCB|nr:rhomboid protease ROM6, putative [Babesia caballi]